MFTSFGRECDQLILEVLLLTEVQQLSFRVYCNQPIFGVFWPTSIQRLLLGLKFPTRRRSSVARGEGLFASDSGSTTLSSASCG